jgi:N-acetylglucosamine kinase-like BadF-type ATPase
MTERIAIGIDGGGTATVAALSRDGTYVASAYGGPANASSRGTAAAAATIVATAREVAGAAPVGAVFVAAAGAGRTAVRDALAEAVRGAFPAAALAVEDDLRVALRAAAQTGPGAVVIAGTGSVAYAENGERSARIGGAGYLAGDEGSAFAMGMAVVKRLVRVYDGRERADETTDAAAAALVAPDRQALLEALYGEPLEPARIAALAPGVVAAADRGNRIATKIVQTAAQELGDLARAAAKAVDLPEFPVVVFAGGLLRENSLLSFLLETRVTNELPGAVILRVRDEPARTALRFAEALF